MLGFQTNFYILVQFALFISTFMYSSFIFKLADIHWIGSDPFHVFIHLQDYLFLKNYTLLLKNLHLVEDYSYILKATVFLLKSMTMYKFNDLTA